jgi:hypothetical protein
MTKLVTQLLRLAQQFNLTKQFRNKIFFYTREYNKDKILEK